MRIYVEVAILSQTRQSKPFSCSWAQSRGFLKNKVDLLCVNQLFDQNRVAGIFDVPPSVLSPLNLMRSSKNHDQSVHLCPPRLRTRGVISGRAGGTDNVHDSCVDTAHR